MSINDTIKRNLDYGRYSVGFRNYFIKDPDRTIEPVGQPRPVLVNVWYPAKEDATKYPLSIGMLLELPFNDETEKELSTNYKNYSRFSLLQYLNQFECEDPEAEGAFTEEHISNYNEYLSIVTQSTRNPESAKGEFPVLIYHMGLGATIDDNFIMCEYLASYGYVILSSLYFKDLERISAGDKQISIQDIKLLIAESLKFSNTDKSKLAVFGHSFGAQLGLSMICEKDSDVKAIVCLDPTFDKYPMEKVLTIWNPEYIDFLITNQVYAKQPYLHFASYFEGVRPYYEIPRKFTSCPRYLLTAKHQILHDGYISLGSFTAANLMKTGSEDLILKKTISAFPFICRGVRAFFDSTLKGIGDFPESLRTEKEIEDFEYDYLEPENISR